MDHQKQLHEILSIVIREGASDLHINTDRSPYIRVAGELVTLSSQPKLSQDDVLGLLKEFLKDSTLNLEEDQASKTPSKLKTFLDEQEVDFSYTVNYEGEDRRLRGNAFFQKSSIGIALRLVPKIKTLEELNLPKILNEFANKKQGFFLVVGPVGQGKSTTMASMVNYINQTRKEHIVTIEDPIEYIFEPNKSIIDQREVGIDTKDFNSALKSAFRQDVNVIMLGEMRNPETIATAVTAAETGHLVLSTLHTNNASQTINRILDSFPTGQQDQVRSQLASSLLGIFSQRLVPRQSGGGLVPAYELLINNNAVANLIREKRTHEIDVIIETGQENGMIDMNRSLAALVKAGEISMESAYNYSLNPKSLERLI